MHLLFLLLFSIITVHAEEGPGICPHGGHAPSTYSDVGSAIDPNG